MDEVASLLKLINDYGIAAIILGAVALYLFKHFSHRIKTDSYELDRKKQIDQRHDEYMEKALDTIVSMVMSRLNVDHFTEEPMNNFSNNNIVQAMKNNLKESGSCRILHFSYHNGGKDYDGRSYQRMSCINEVTQDNVFPIQNKYNNMFRTSMFYIYQELNTKGYFNIENIASLEKEDPGTYQMLLADDVYAAFGKKISNSRGQIIGFLVLCYDKPQKNITKIVSTLQKTVYQIEGIYLAEKEEV